MVEPAILAAFAALTVAAWAFANQPTPEPPWPSRIQGFSIQPYQKDQDAIARDDPTTQQVDSDLKLLAGKTNSVRTYSTLGTLGEIPALARDHDNVARLIIGNEVVLRGDLAVDEIAAHLDRVRAAARQPVSTA